MLIGKILCQDSTHNNTADHSSLQENCDKWNLPPSPTSVQKIIDCALVKYKEKDAQGSASSPCFCK